MKKTVRVSLTSGNAISTMQNELDLFMQKIKRQCEEFVNELAKRGVEIATVKFGEAIYAGTNDVTVDIQVQDKLSTAVVATGEATLFIEFGTGILYPDDHPEKVDGVVPRGTHGKGQGSRPDGWRYYGETGNEPGTRIVRSNAKGNLVHTYGNPANASLYQTREELRRDWESIARRVFK